MIGDFNVYFQIWMALAPSIGDGLGVWTFDRRRFSYWVMLSITEFVIDGVPSYHLVL
jgi:hypothetical protein